MTARHPTKKNIHANTTIPKVRQKFATRTRTQDALTCWALGPCIHNAASEVYLKPYQSSRNPMRTIRPIPRATQLIVWHYGRSVKKEHRPFPNNQMVYYYEGESARLWGLLSLNSKWISRKRDRLQSRNAFPQAQAPTLCTDRE